MAFMDLFKGIGGLFSRIALDSTRRPDGGTSHYRPLRKKSAEGDPSRQDAPGTDAQAFSYVHTGFTGMNPPVGYGYETAQSPVRNDYPRQAEPMQQPSYIGMGSFGGRTDFSAPVRDNISYMPGVAQGPSRGAVHIEHIITLTGLKSCYEAIECMKDGETLIVTLDAIANENESMRCQDMLAGAAFTLGCSVRLLSGARIVVIAPEGVKILPEQAEASLNYRPAEMLTAQQPVAEAAQPARRERRTGANAAEWNAARNGQLNNYNPYTGTMPVAAGSYGSFGGYGY